MRVASRRLLLNQPRGSGLAAVNARSRRSARTFPYIPTDFSPQGVASIPGGAHYGDATPSDRVILPLPCSDLQIGDVLLASVRIMAGSGTWTWPTGWTEMWDSAADASADSFTGAYRIVSFDANEAETVTPVYSGGAAANAAFAGVAFHVRGSGTPQVSSVATGTSTTPNPPSFSPSGGAKDYLWLALAGQESTTSVSAFPTNYSISQGVQTADSGAGGNAAGALAWAFRELNTATEDPGSFTFNANEDWMAVTVAFPPG